MQVCTCSKLRVLQILVTHHVELVLPGAQYIIRMLDGRIDSQGTMTELRAQGVLDDITQEAAVEVQKEETAVAVEEPANYPNPDGKIAPEAVAPRKLIKDEHRETGSVKWTVYKKYLKASYVTLHLIDWSVLQHYNTFVRSYWIWAFLVSLVFLSQIMTILEKVWIIVCFRCSFPCLNIELMPVFQIWGDAYGQDSLKVQECMYHSLSIDGRDSGVGNITKHNLHMVFANESKRYGINWPSAYQHPLFYIGLYAAIGAINVLINTSSVVSQYTAALRASRTLFQ